MITNQQRGPSDQVYCVKRSSQKTLTQLCSQLSVNTHGLLVDNNDNNSKIKLCPENCHWFYLSRSKVKVKHTHSYWSFTSHKKYNHSSQAQSVVHTTALYCSRAIVEGPHKCNKTTIKEFYKSCKIIAAYLMWLDIIHQHNFLQPMTASRYGMWAEQRLW